MVKSGHRARQKETQSQRREMAAQKSRHAVELATRDWMEGRQEKLKEQGPTRGNCPRWGLDRAARQRNMHSLHRPSESP
jgi:hypothetical protein